MSEQGLPGPRGASIILDGAVAIVTGASTGIGRAVAHALHERGARVVVSGRRAQLLDPVARELGGLAVACDVSDYAQVERLVARAVEWGGRLDVMVNNAGIGAFGRVHELDPERTSEMVMTNVVGVAKLAYDLELKDREKAAEGDSRSRPRRLLARLPGIR